MLNDVEEEKVEVEDRLRFNSSLTVKIFEDIFVLACNGSSKACQQSSWEKEQVEDC